MLLAEVEDMYRNVSSILMFWVHNICIVVRNMDTRSVPAMVLHLLNFHAIYAIGSDALGCAGLASDVYSRGGQ